MGKCQTTGHVLPRSFDLTPPHHLPTIHVSPKMSWCHFPPHSFWIQGYRTVQTAKCALERNKLKLDYLRLCQRGASVKSENQFRPSTLVHLNTALIVLARERLLCFVGRILYSLDLCIFRKSPIGQRLTDLSWMRDSHWSWDWGIADWLSIIGQLHQRSTWVNLLILAWLSLAAHEKVL